MHLVIARLFQQYVFSTTNTFFLQILTIQRLQRKKTSVHTYRPVAWETREANLV